MASVRSHDGERMARGLGAVKYVKSSASLLYSTTTNTISFRTSSRPSTPTSYIAGIATYSTALPDLKFSARAPFPARALRSHQQQSHHIQFSQHPQLGIRYLSGFFDIGSFSLYIFPSAPLSARHVKSGQQHRLRLACPKCSIVTLSLRLCRISPDFFHTNLGRSGYSFDIALGNLCQAGETEHQISLRHRREEKHHFPGRMVCTFLALFCQSLNSETSSLPTVRLVIFLTWRCLG